MFLTPNFVAQVRNALSVASVMVTLLTASASLGADDWALHRQSAPHMGTQWHVALYSRDSESANRAFDAAWAVIREIDEQLTNYDNNSELMRLCRSAPHAEPVPVGDHLWCVLKSAQQISVKTSGAFDVTVGPMTKLWRRARRQRELPKASLLASARDIVGYELMAFSDDHQSIRLPKKGMQLDLGGIAKGYGVDQAIHAIRAAGIESALVNGGGDLAVSSPPPSEKGWLIKLASLDPTKKSARKEMRLANAAIATSGDAWQFVEIEGRRYSHIVDPRTGMGLSHRSAATVVAPTCMLADAWASAVCVVGAEEGLKLSDQEAGIEVRVTTLQPDGRIDQEQSLNFPH